MRDQAVLCRTNARLDDISAALEICGIPVLHLGSLFERNEVRDLLALLTLAVDSFGDGLARVGAMPRYDIPLQDMRLILRLMRERSGPAAGKMRDVAVDEGLSVEGRTGLARLAADLDGVNLGMSPWDMLLTYLLDRTDHLAQLARRESVRDRMQAVAIWQFLNFVRDRSPVGHGAPIHRVLDRVRQLVLLAEERDLRQIPAGALHMDAVRLMTVHGSKGLEFDAVHIPGLTKASFPASFRGQRCPPPVGMIPEGNAAREHDMEEECLFFVALSRAFTHLRLYLFRKQANGNNRAPSQYLDWFSGAVTEMTNSPEMPLPPDAPQPTPIRVTWPDDWNVTDSRLHSYEGCPRRFFYTHVLGLGAAKKSTAFSQTHDCLYDLIEWLAEARVEGAPGLTEAAQEFERIWAARGPVTHGFAGDYRRLAERLVAALVNSGAGVRFRQAEPLALDLLGGRVVVQPDEMSELQNGTVILRRIRTGYKRDAEYDALEYALYHLAGQAHFGTAYSVEAVHLTDEVREQAVVTPAKIRNRKAKAESMLTDISAGKFPPKPDSVRCPRCPHFFVCDAGGRGPISLRT